MNIPRYEEEIAFGIIRLISSIYVQFMKFMKQVGNGELNLQEPDDEAAAWSQEFINANSKEDSDNVAQSWVEEHGPVSGMYL